MADICKVCNGAVAKTDIACPHCGAPLDKIPGNGAKTADVDEILNSLLRERAAVQPDVPADTEPRGDPVPFGSVGGEETPAAPQDPGADLSVRREAERISQPVRRMRRAPDGMRPGALEARINAVPRAPKGGRVSRVLIVLMVLAVLALFAAIFIVYVLPSQEQSRQQQQILAYLEGAWLSDEFAYADSTAMNHVEVLEVREDGTYRLAGYVVSDGENPSGWRDGSWENESEYAGNLVYDAETQQIMLFHREGEEEIYFVRILVVREDDRMVLREYYDESKSRFFDIVFTRAAPDGA